ncbi:hypothetical protein SLEP1_g41833 [Rubroshorea leprosula]|uniref:DUF4283 domain-containing protein n=1 Tax=Rubroshorea leprosula TaxID=152421 RepID=A0AAV5L8E8_9ROSI|nr:hypothetical protein SLEP1_g41833 [Rubroshorea leprosula]
MNMATLPNAPDSLTLSSPNTQEDDLLARSVKRIKEDLPSTGRWDVDMGDDVNVLNPAICDVDGVSNAPAETACISSQLTVSPNHVYGSEPLSYKDKLLLEEKSEGISFATIPNYLDEDSDVDEDPTSDIPVILLSKAEKRRIREPWANALIIKAFAPKPVGYNFLYPRVQEDLNRVIFGGPWFVGPYYLTIRRWEPNFDPTMTTFSTTVVWARLPHLSADHYDPITLQKIGNKSSLLPVSVHSELDQLSRNFIWGSDEQHRKIHLIKWDTVCQPRHLGGLGLKKSRDANIVAMCKLNWRLHFEKSNTWSKLFCRKYSIVNPRDPLPNHGSPTLQAMKEGRSLFQRGLRWIPRNGNSIFFWNDCWVGNQPLSKVFYGPHLPSLDSLLLADVLLDGSTSGIAYHLPQELLAQMQAIPIATNTTLEDNFSWIGSSNGNFSPSSALCLLRDLPTTKDCT